MNSWQTYLLVIAAALLFAAILCGAIRKGKERRQQDFTRSLETLLQPKETIKVICPQKGFRCILTNSRVIFEKKGDFSAFPIKSVTKVQGANDKGNRTAVPDKMVTCTIHIDREYILRNNCPEFADLVSQLSEKVKKQKEKKKSQAQTSRKSKEENHENHK